MSNDFFVLIEEEKRKKSLLDVPFYIAGAVIFLMILMYFIIKPEPVGNIIYQWIIFITGFVALLIILRFIAHHAFSKRIKKLQIQALLNSSSNAEEERLINLSSKQVNDLYQNLKR